MWIKVVHVACALLTLVSFSLRGVWMLRGLPLSRRWVPRILPHVIDTVLLLSGLAMAIGWYGAFYREDWLVAKLAGVLIYIVCGMVALQPGHPRPVRAVAFAGALLVFGWIVWVAHSRSIVFPLQWTTAL